MTDTARVVTFNDAPPPPGLSPWVDGAEPAGAVAVAPPDPTWPAQFTALAAVIREAVGYKQAVIP